MGIVNKQFAKFLKANGYYVRKEVYSWGYDSWIVKGKGIEGRFCSKNFTTGNLLSGGFVADNVNAFNKWSQCPLVVKLPLTIISEVELLRQLEWLGSDEGYEHSNCFEYLDNRVLAYEVSYDE